MIIRFTENAKEDLARALAYAAREYPALLPIFESQLARIIGRLAMWPESARPVEGFAGVRVIVLGRFPYKLFYRADTKHLDVLHIRHDAQDDSAMSPTAKKP